MRNIKYCLFMIITCFSFLNIAHADSVCTYTNSSINFTCTVYERKNIVACTSSYPTAGTKGNSLTVSGSIKCENVPTVYLDAYLDNSVGTLYYYDINTTNVCTQAKVEYDKVKPAGLPAGSNECIQFHLTSSNNNTTVESENESGGGPTSVIPDDGNGGTPTNPNDDNSTGGGTNEGSDNAFDMNNFCSRSEVSGTFRFLGYIFFILKILIPIIIIVMASIDFGKAVIAQKDDEIKKSMKALVIRIIAGIIIFFVPSILNFVLNVISEDNKYGPNNLYNENTGTFKDCTTCLFKPFTDSCKNLLED